MAYVISDLGVPGVVGPIDPVAKLRSHLGLPSGTEWDAALEVAVVTALGGMRPPIVMRRDHIQELVNARARWIAARHSIFARPLR